MAKKYNDTTILNWGDYNTPADYSKTPLGAIPFEFLLDLFKSHKTIHPKLSKYIEEKIKERGAEEERELAAKEKLEKERLADEKARAEEEAKPFYRILNDKFAYCRATNKIIYVSEKEAKREIRRISEREQDNKKPVRAYECEKCGGWHLTSIPFEEWEKHTEEESGNRAIYSRIMIRQSEEENEKLNNRIAHLEEQLRLLSDDLAEMREASKQLKKDNHVLSSEMGKDKHVKAIEKTLKEKLAEIEDLKMANGDLINRLFVLERGKKTGK